MLFEHLTLYLSVFDFSQVIMVSRFMAVKYLFSHHSEYTRWSVVELIAELSLMTVASARKSTILQFSATALVTFARVFSLTVNRKVFLISRRRPSSIQQNIRYFSAINSSARNGLSLRFGGLGLCERISKCRAKLSDLS